ncbi:hypothetical protein EYR40_007515 [Pleurotus pulmonarius]|nr:hypothetical protein EYR40_007515 [Pleurotus pulmonarius]
MASSSVGQESMQPTVASVGPRFRPYASPSHQVTKGRYITSNDPRGYIPVYEYPLNGQWIMMDIDDGYVLWTGIWKALGNSKADIVKMIDSQPDLANHIRRVRGGYLKIQGTWMPYEVALRLARRVAWTIRDDLIPLFGPTFPSTCLSPDQPGYGQVVASGTGRRRTRRVNNSATAPVTLPRESQSNWTVVTPTTGASQGIPLQPQHQQQYPHAAMTMHSLSRRPSDPHSRSEGPSSYRGVQPEYYEAPGPPSPSTNGDNTPSKDRNYSRYSPYPGTSSTSHLSRRPSSSGRSTLHLDIPALSLRDDQRMVEDNPPLGERITLPPIRHHGYSDSSGGASYSLPPISALEDLRGVHAHDSAAVLRRLMEDDSQDIRRSSQDSSWGRHRSLSAPPYKPAYEAPSTQPMRRSDSGHVPQSFGETIQRPNHLSSELYPSQSSRRLSDGSHNSYRNSPTYEVSPISPSPSTPLSTSSSRDYGMPCDRSMDAHRKDVHLRVAVPPTNDHEHPSALSGSQPIPYASRTWSNILN